MEQESAETQKPPPLLRNTDPDKLPAAKREEWSLRAATWNEYTEEERKRWCAWVEWAVSEEGELWGAKGRRAVLREAHLEGADLQFAKLEGAYLPRAHLEGANLGHAQLERANLWSADLEGAYLLWAHLEGAYLGGAHLEGANLRWAHLEGADLTFAHLGGPVLGGAVLDDALLHRVDFSKVDLKDARLFGTRITEPQNLWYDWPRATLRGTVFPERIPVHPIQDVRGLPPAIRRRIADLQWLRDVHARANRFGRAAIWLWGLTSRYGQSIVLWALWSLLMVLAFTRIFLGLEFNIAAHHIEDAQAVAQVDCPGPARALYFSVVTFTTLGFGDVTPVTNWGRFFVALEVFVGYVMLGALISILASKFARLS